MITGDQKAHFDAFGFLVLRQMLAPDETEVVISEFEAAMLEDRGGMPFDGKKRQIVNDWFRDRPAVQFLMDDQRIHGTAERLLGPDFIFQEGNDGNFYVGDTGWHPDLGWDPRIPRGRSDPDRTDGPWHSHYTPGIKVAFYLDPVQKDTGCLRVIPGSHLSPYNERLWSLHMDIPADVAESDRLRAGLLEMWERDTGSPEGGDRLLSDPSVNHFDVEPSEIPGFPIESQPGDAVFFSHQVWHSSFGGQVGRRMFTLNFHSA